MSGDDFEQRFQHHVEFMLEQQSRFDERLNKLEESQIRQAENIDRLTADVQLLAQVVEANRLDTREAIDNLIISNEVTRKLSEDVARLAAGTSQRVTGIDRRVTDLESQ